MPRPVDPRKEELAREAFAKCDTRDDLLAFCKRILHDMIRVRGAKTIQSIEHWLFHKKQKSVLWHLMRMNNEDQKWLNLEEISLGLVDPEVARASQNEKGDTARHNTEVGHFNIETSPTDVCELFSEWGTRLSNTDFSVLPAKMRVDLVWQTHIVLLFALGLRINELTGEHRADADIPCRLDFKVTGVLVMFYCGSRTEDGRRLPYPKAPLLPAATVSLLLDIYFNNIGDVHGHCTYLTRGGSKNFLRIMKEAGLSDHVTWVEGKMVPSKLRALSATCFPYVHDVSAIAVGDLAPLEATKLFLGHDKGQVPVTARYMSVGMQSRYQDGKKRIKLGKKNDQLCVLEADDMPSKKRAREE